MRAMKTLPIIYQFLGLIFVAGQTFGGETGVEIQFVLSARELPELGFGRKPDAYVEVTYYRSPDQAPGYFTNRTSTVGASYNPEWPDVFSVTFFEGHQQKIRFVVKHGRNEEIGKVTVSLLEITKAQGGQLEKTIIGANPTSGRLIINFVINKASNDDTDPRLLQPKKVKVLKRLVETIDR